LNFARLTLQIPQRPQPIIPGKGIDRHGIGNRRLSLLAKFLRFL
jgi:hypothetical protein